MIETWRQCVTSGIKHLTSDLLQVLVIGPLRGGGYIKEVRIHVVGKGEVDTRVGVGVSGTPGTEEHVFAAATPLINYSGYKMAKVVPAIKMRTSPFVGLCEWVLPVWHQVDTGARYVLVGVDPDTVISFWLWGTVTVVGVSRPVNGLGVEDGLDR